MSTAASSAASVAFSPQDYSRFLIREFLKKNGFDETYNSFMMEDTRPKVTMTKNQLTSLLGIENLMKKNSKSKNFTTMLDIICNFLVDSKEDSKETPAIIAEKKIKPQRPEDSKKPQRQSGWNDPAEPASEAVAQQFYGNAPATAEEKKRTKNLEHIDEDWGDFDDEAKMGGEKNQTYIPD